MKGALQVRAIGGELVYRLPLADILQFPDLLEALESQGAHQKDAVQAHVDNCSASESLALESVLTQNGYPINGALISPLWQRKRPVELAHQRLKAFCFIVGFCM